tara:strand:- start:256 stop:810 length:555 start_codon:yes stop_codon:yes gene_type:complete
MSENKVYQAVFLRVKEASHVTNGGGAYTYRALYRCGSRSIRVGIMACANPMNSRAQVSIYEPGSDRGWNQIILDGGDDVEINWIELQKDIVEGHGLQDEKKPDTLDALARPVSLDFWRKAALDLLSEAVLVDARLNPNAPIASKQPQHCRFTAGVAALNEGPGVYVVVPNLIDPGLIMWTSIPV